MEKEKRVYFSIIFYILVSVFCFYILKYFIKDALLVSFGISTLYFVALFVRSSDSSLVPSFLHNTAGLFLGFVWIGFVVTIILNILNIFLEINLIHRLIGLVASLIIALSAIVNNKYIANRKFTIQSPHMKKKVRLAHISDLHINGPKAKESFEKIIAQVISQNPDIIVITGDLLDVPSIPKEDCFDILYQIKTPILFVTGNHDYYAGAKYVETLLTKRNVIVLRGEATSIHGIHFTGVDDPTSKIKLPHALEKIKLPKDEFKVLLYHQPLHVPYVASKGFDLMLSGHTHAGQLFPFNYVVRLQFKYVQGFHKIKDMILYINPGTGTWEMPMRIGSRNTIAVFDIVPKKK